MADSIEETDVAVVGAGGGGAVLALALAKQGISTVVLDQAVGPPKGFYVRMRNLHIRCLREEVWGWLSA